VGTHSTTKLGGMWHFQPEVGEDHTKHVWTKRQHHETHCETQDTDEHRGAKLTDEPSDYPNARVRRERARDIVGGWSTDCQCPQRAFPSCWRDTNLLLVEYWTLASAHRHPLLACLTAQCPQLLQLVDLLPDGLKADQRDERGKNFKNKRLQVWQGRHNPLGDLKQRLRDRPRMRVQPKALQLEPTCQMDLPDTVERELRQKRFHGGPAVQAIGENVVEVK
jgi:hypothetical protein